MDCAAVLVPQVMPACVMASGIVCAVEREIASVTIKISQGFHKGRPTCVLWVIGFIRETICSPSFCSTFPIVGNMVSGTGHLLTVEGMRVMVLFDHLALVECDLSLASVFLKTTDYKGG